MLHRITGKEESPAEATDGTEKEVNTCGKTSLGQRHTQTLHQQLRRRRIQTDIDTHMTDDADERKQDNPVAQQSKAIGEGRTTLGTVIRLLHLRNRQDNQCRHPDSQEDKVEDTPVSEANRRPTCDNRREEGSNRLDKLPEGQRTRQAVARNDIRKQGIQRHLHQCIPNPKKRERHQHGRKTIIQQRQQQCQSRYDQAEKHRLLLSDTVHQHPRGDGEDQEPEENHRREKIRHRVGETEVRLHVVRRYAHQIDEAHRKESQHDGNYRHEKFLIHLKRIQITTVIPSTFIPWAKHPPECRQKPPYLRHSDAPRPTISLARQKRRKLPRKNHRRRRYRRPLHAESAGQTSRPRQRFCCNGYRRSGQDTEGYNAARFVGNKHPHRPRDRTSA